MNLEALLSHLLKKKLLSQCEYQELDFRRELRQRQNQYFLLNILPGKGRGAFNKFLECLKAEKEHLGHQDIVETLLNYDKIR